MKLIYKFILSVLLFFYSADCVISQTFDELIQLNRENLINLYEQRGLPPEWVSTGNVAEEDLKRVLNKYNAEVGLLIYVHQNDTLATMLIDRMGKIIRNEKYIEETALVNEIEKVNKWFSNNTLSRAPEKRGAMSIPAIDNFEYRDAYEKIGSLLLPFETDELSRFKHIIIIPVLNISIVPFAALKISEDKYLIDILSYSIAPSLYEIMVNSQMKENRELYSSEAQYHFKNALFVANPSFPKDSIWNFPALPGTENEINYRWVLKIHFFELFQIQA